MHTMNALVLLNLCLGPDKYCFIATDKFIDSVDGRPCKDGTGAKGNLKKKRFNSKDFV